jgi:hypothetical protein
MIRQSKPGEKVIVLLPIPCHPLQANYAWPYVIESRLNDLNYIVNTLTRLSVIFIMHFFKCDGVVISKHHEWIKCTSKCLKDNNKASIFFFQLWIILVDIF